MGLVSSNEGCRGHTAALVAMMCSFSSFQSLLTSAREGQDVMRLLVELCSPCAPDYQSEHHTSAATLRLAQDTARIKYIAVLLTPC